MKEGMDSTAVGRAPDTSPSQSTPASDEFANRRLIRPALTRDGNRSDAPGERRERPLGMGKKAPPPEQTHAENFYYQKQMQSKTPMVIVLKDGEEVHGLIEWYDRNCIKIIRSGGQSNLLIYKPAIKYIFKEGENGRKA